MAQQANTYDWRMDRPTMRARASIPHVVCAVGCGERARPSTHREAPSVATGSGAVRCLDSRAQHVQFEGSLTTGLLMRETVE